MLYQGSTASLIANILGHYSWFLAHNILDEKIPPSADNLSAVSLVFSKVDIIFSAIHQCVLIYLVQLFVSVCAGKKSCTFV